MTELNSKVHDLMEEQESVDKHINEYEGQLKPLYMERDEIAAHIPSQAMAVDPEHVDFGAYVTKGVQLVKGAGKEQGSRLLELLYD